MTRLTGNINVTSIRGLTTIVSLITAATLTACVSDAPVEPTSAVQPSATRSTLLGSGPIGKGCLVGQLPELVVTSVNAVSATTAGVVQVQATIKNSGTGCAGTFRIEGQEWLSSGLIAARLDVDPSADVDASGFTLRTLAPGQTISVTGKITLPVFAHGELAVFNVLADGCAYVGDEFFPTYCRVAEVREDNNLAQAIVRIP